MKLMQYLIAEGFWTRKQPVKPTHTPVTLDDRKLIAAGFQTANIKIREVATDGGDQIGKDVLNVYVRGVKIRGMRCEVSFWKSTQDQYHGIINYYRDSISTRPLTSREIKFSTAEELAKSLN